MGQARATLYFVRHGETDWNAEGRLQGQRDTPLNALGRVQAEQAAHKLAALAVDPAGLDYLASPMARTRETMEILRRTLGLSPVEYRTDDRLKEITFGRWEGSTWKEVRARDPAGARAREADKWGFVPPEGESYETLAARVAPVLDTITRDTVMVAHGGVARALLALACGVPTEQAPRVDIWQGRLLVIRDGRFDWR